MSRSQIRHDGRMPDQLRDIRIMTGCQQAAEGSALIEMGNTAVLCAASVEEDVPGWMRGRGSGWVTAQDNDKAHVVGRQEGRGGSLCPIKIEDEKYPLGIYRLVRHVQIGDEIGFYKTPTFEKKPPES